MQLESTSIWHAQWAEAAENIPGLRLFALVDSAADPRAVTMMRQEDPPNECLFGYPLHAPIASSTPRLAAIADVRSSRLAGWLLRSMPARPVGTLLASTSSLPELATHLRRCIDVELAGLDSMFLAVWDPCILATLVGQPDDRTLHVAGPVLKAQQLSDLLVPIHHWWYWDREGGLHDAVPPPLRAARQDATSARFEFDDAQTDALVEASVPDHLLQHVRQNQPELLERLAASEHYRFVRQQLGRARGHGLQGMGDLVNYLCLALAYGARFDEVPAMAALLAQVEAGSSTFNAALDKVPEADLEAAAAPPTLL